MDANADLDLDYSVGHVGQASQTHNNVGQPLPALPASLLSLAGCVCFLAQSPKARLQYELAGFLSCSCSTPTHGVYIYEYIFFRVIDSSYEY